LDNTLIKFKSKKEIVDFLNDFLSPIEKTILAKRLAISVLLAKGNSYENISNILRVTPNTITKMSLKMKYGNGSVKKVSESITNSDSGKAIIEEILGVIQRKHINLGGDEFKTPSWERDRKIRRLKKGI
jgi:uncharacterized protein YerC